MKTKLNISHNIFLTKKQRYDLHNGASISVKGVSVPVWYGEKFTTEPAKEVFCKYRLTNVSPNKNIELIKGGYKINMPQNEEGLEKPYPTSIDLLDLADGGCEQISFQQVSPIYEEGKKQMVLHNIEIKCIEELLETMTYEE